MRKIYPENVRRITATVGSKTYNFRSEGEMMWAQYLEWLKESGEIRNWCYEGKTFYFRNEKTAPVQYTPDFWITPIGGMVYCQEFKRGHLDGQAVTKFRRMAKHYPGVIIELVITNKCKKDAHRLYIVKKYVRRIIDADIIFKQMGNLIKTAGDYRLGQKIKELTGE